MATVQETLTALVGLINQLAALATAPAPAPATGPTGPVIAAFRVLARPTLEDRSTGTVLSALVNGKAVELARTPRLKAGAWTTVPVAPTAAQGWQAQCAPNSYGNVKVQALDAAGNVLTGTVFGDKGAYQNGAATVEKAMSDDLGAFYDAATPTPGPFGQRFAAPAAVITNAGPGVKLPVPSITRDPLTGDYTLQFAKID